MTTTIDHLVTNGHNATNGHNGTGNAQGVSKDFRKVSEDPLIFFRKIAESLGINIKGDDFMSYRDRTEETGPLIGTSMFTGTKPPYLELMITLAYSSNGTYTQNGKNLTPLPEDFQEAFYYRGGNLNPSRDDLQLLKQNFPRGYSNGFNFSTDDLRFFEQYSKNMLVRFWLLYNKRRSRDGELKMEIKIHQPEPGVFSMEKSVPEPSMSRDIHDIITGYEFNGDYRPFLHRMLEMFANVPKNQWHNPSIYTGTSSIDEFLPQYFTPQEVARIKEHEHAFLRSRRDFASVPRLNLGPIVLPTPGADIATQLHDRGQFVVEYLSQMGYMSKQDATALIARRVINRLMPDFQRSPEMARTILEKL